MNEHAQGIVHRMEQAAVTPDLAAAVAADREVTEGANGLKRGSMRVGWYGRMIKVTAGFEALGYGGVRDASGNPVSAEKAYWLQKGIGRSTWYRMTGLAEKFKEMRAEDFIRMTAENAEHLATLPEEERYKPEWVVRAEQMDEESFQKAVLEHRAEVAATPVAEVPVTFKMSLFAGQRDVIAQSIERFRQDHQLSTPGQALEYMAIESVGKKTFTQFVQGALPTLRSALSLTKDVDDPESAMQAMREAVEQVVYDLAAALEEAGVQGRWNGSRKGDDDRA